MSSARLLGLDSSLWIYWFEADEEHLHVVSPVLQQVLDGEVEAVTSVLSVTEVLTGTFARKNEVLARRYRDFFEDTAGVTVLDVDREIAVQAARLRARYTLRTPDAIHVATAIAARAAAFVTTDRRLSVVREIEVRVLRPDRPRGGR